MTGPRNLTGPAQSGPVRWEDMTAHRIPVYYSPAFNDVQHVWDSTKKHDHIHAALRARPDLPLTFLEPTAATRDQLTSIHDDAYVNAVITGEPRSLAQSNDFEWCPGMYRAVTLTNGGMVDAARAALRTGVAGVIASGFHHAESSRGMGFCTFNGLVLAAVELRRAELVRRVAILDLDYHYGNGQVEMIRRYGLNDYLENYGVHRAQHADEYLDLAHAQVQRLLSWSPDLVLYQAGMDPHEHDALGGVPGMSAARLRARDRMVFEALRAAGVPVAFNMAGGYARDRAWLNGGGAVNPVVALHVATFEEACRVWSVPPGR